MDRVIRALIRLEEARKLETREENETAGIISIVPLRNPLKNGDSLTVTFTLAATLD